MGLLEEIYGDGFKLDLELETDRVAPGGQVAGQVVLAGGREAAELRSLAIDLAFVNIHGDFQTAPRIDVDEVPGQRLEAGLPLAPGARIVRRFAFPLPAHADPEGSWRVRARAEVGGRPSIRNALGLHVCPEESFARVLDLLDPRAVASPRQRRVPEDRERLIEQLTAVQHIVLDEGRDLRYLGPSLLGRVAHPLRSVSSLALRTWETVMRRAGPRASDLDELARTARIAPRPTQKAVVRTLARFAHQGGLPVVEELLPDLSARARAVLALALWLEAPVEAPDRRALLARLTEDPIPDVRAAAWAAHALYRAEPETGPALTRAAAFDRSLEVKGASLAALALCHPYGQRELVLDTFTVVGRSTSPRVRLTAASALPWLPPDPSTTRLVKALLADPDVRVRRRMASGSGRMAGHPGVEELFLRAALEDPDENVRGRALGGLGRLMDLRAAFGVAFERLAVDTCEATAWGVLELARTEPDEPEARQLLNLLSSLPLKRVAHAARYELGWG